MSGKSREAVEINRKLDSLVLSIKSTYQSLLAKGMAFTSTGIKEQFQGCLQARCMLIERFDRLIKEKEEHLGIDFKRRSLSAYYSTRHNLQTFIEDKYKVKDLAFSRLTESFIYDFQDYCLGKLGLQETTFYGIASYLKLVCKLAYREGLSDTLLFANAKIAKGDKKLPKALDRCSLDKLMNLKFGELEDEMETARDLFVFACHT